MSRQADKLIRLFKESGIPARMGLARSYDRIVVHALTTAAELQLTKKYSAEQCAIYKAAVNEIVLNLAQESGCKAEPVDTPTDSYIRIYDTALRGVDDEVNDDPVLAAMIKAVNEGPFRSQICQLRQAFDIEFMHFFLLKIK